MNPLLRKLNLPKKDSHKAENGKLLVVGGGREYHGAPFFSINAAKRFCDLVYFMPGSPAPNILHSIRNIPEAIISSGFPDADCALYGPGLGSSKFPFSKVSERYEKIVIDGDGLRKIRRNSLEGCILTPHEKEFEDLSGAPATPKEVKRFAAENSCTILKKGKVDIITDGKKMVKNRKGNAGMTKGGTGDVLSGLTAALFCMNSPLVAAASAAFLTGYAGDLLFKKQKYAYCASDLAEALPLAFKKALEKQ
ncbi:NAD(P)H-hydrate dehydratase [Candidatus Micrarchaeota archaeon]|nr:NAD(P)H-hydrate dehydratase [Candidatus Micrarchaeota archaeon]